ASFPSRVSRSTEAKQWTTSAMSRCSPWIRSMALDMIVLLAWSLRGPSRRREIDQVIHHLPHARRALGRDLEGPALRLRADEAPELRHAVGHDDVQGSGAGPGLVLDAPQQRLANLSVVQGLGRAARAPADQSAQQVGAADDADERAVLQNRHPLDAVALEQGRQLGERRVRRRRND